MTSYNPPYGDRVKAIGGPVSFENTYKFEAQDGGTLLTVSGQVKLGGCFKIAERLASKQIEKQTEADAAALKKLLEAG